MELENLSYISVNLFDDNSSLAPWHVKVYACLEQAFLFLSASSPFRLVESLHTGLISKFTKCISFTSSHTMSSL